jgi:hypothetical protein
MMIVELLETFRYVPLEHMNPGMVNSGLREKAEASLTCWNCKSSFSIIGVSMDLDWVAGKCQCDYMM